MNMNTDKYDLAVEFGGSPVPTNQSRNLRRWWSVITSLMALAVLMEAIFAGAMMSGVGWARAAHSVNAAVLIASAFTAGLVCVVTLRGIPDGLKLGLALLSLAAVVLLQAAIGALTAKGTNLLWVHVPLGVALFGFAVRAAAGARRLHGE
jgi:hypothetical protein